MIAGIDFGSKRAGTTVICYQADGGMIGFVQSKKGQDADSMILDFLARHRMDRVFIDAPLSLPGVYRELPGYADHFYREADRKTGAMSPMFLGGLTARAMQLKQTLSTEGIVLIETYPGYLARHLGLKELGYKKGAAYLPPVRERLEELTGWRLDAMAMGSWHEIDALLALWSHRRHLEGQSLSFGREEEGRIHV